MRRVAAGFWIFGFALRKEAPEVVTEPEPAAAPSG